MGEADANQGGAAFIPRRQSDVMLKSAAGIEKPALAG